ncbi:MAG: esterase/lipase family protein [Isosphaeraceae bacterium]
MRSFARNEARRRRGEAASRPAVLPWPLLIAILLLQAGCASIVIHDRPILDRASFETSAGASPASANALALVQAGVALDQKNPAWAITYYRDAALHALPAVISEGVSLQLDIKAARGGQGIYRRAIEYMLETVNRQATRTGSNWTDILAAVGISVRGRVSVYQAARWGDVLPTRRFEVKGFHHQAGQGGIGAPVVVHLTRAGDWGEASPQTTGNLTEPCEMHFPKTLYRSASATLRPGSGPGEPIAVLELHDPVRDPIMKWQAAPGAPALPLAYDMTVPLARQFHIANLNLLGALGVLWPSEYNGRTGIYLIDPYEPGKIPIVFVHGLMSSPEAWDNAINDLRGDPELRKRYQFWLFFYSTGNPILASGGRFRKALTDLRVQLDPEKKDQAFDRMVLIGHSMGGLLSRLAISNSGQILWNTASKVPPDEIAMGPQLKAEMLQSLIFQPIPSVSRVIFISTPHRGSPLGDELIGRLASRMISVPRDILQIRKTLALYNGQANVSEAFRSSRYATSVAQLGLGNPVLQAIGKLPLSEKVPYHSIIGYNHKEPLPAGGDGVVPYTSAHIEGALSELIITSDHSAQEKQEAIVEMRRILTLHFNEYALERKALAQGEKPSPRMTRPHGHTPVRLALTQPAIQPPDGGRVARSAPRQDPVQVR